MNVLRTCISEQCHTNTLLHVYDPEGTGTPPVLKQLTNNDTTEIIHGAASAARQLIINHEHYIQYNMTLTDVQVFVHY